MVRLDHWDVRNRKRNRTINLNLSMKTNDPTMEKMKLTNYWIVQSNPRFEKLTWPSYLEFDRRYDSVNERKIKLNALKTKRTWTLVFPFVEHRRQNNKPNEKENDERKKTAGKYERCTVRRGQYQRFWRITTIVKKIAPTWLMSLPIRRKSFFIGWNDRNFIDEKFFFLVLFTSK